MKKDPIKVKILDMKYDEEDHIFIMAILDIDKNKNVNLAMRAEDFSVPRGTPVNIINNFCKEMTGKEKNLFIEQDNYKGYIDKPSYSEILSLQEEMDKYPYKELIRKKLNEG